MKERERGSSCRVEKKKFEFIRFDEDNQLGKKVDSSHDNKAQDSGNREGHIELPTLNMLSVKKQQRDSQRTACSSCPG